jgi:transposase
VHHLARKLATFGHDTELMPAKYVRPYAKGQKNDFNDAEAIAEAVQGSAASRAVGRRHRGRTLGCRYCNYGRA